MKNLALILLFFISSSCYSAVYDTLPKGVNTFVLKNIFTSDITSKYNSSNQNEELSLNKSLTSNDISNISSTLKNFVSELNSLSPEAYSKLNLGSFDAKAEASITAQGLGFGVGLTDQLTVFTSIPIYHLKTKINYKQTTPSNLNEVKNIIQNATPKTGTESLIKQLFLQVPNINEEFVQSIATNYFNYKPLGTWESDSIGDIEIGAIYRLTNLEDRGSAITLGVVVPSGKIDDANNLQDIATGDGQYDVYFENASGIKVLDQQIELSIKSKFSYQFGSYKYVRVYDDPSFPISRDLKNIYIKPGNKIEITPQITYQQNSLITYLINFSHNQTFKSNFNIDEEKSKFAMEKNSDTTENWIKLGINFSTIELFKTKKFDLPLEIGLSAQKIFEAKNTVQYERFDLDLKFYF